jgi:hypothetical protein
VSTHQALRYRRSLNFNQPLGLDPVKSQEPLPMADQSNELRGVLFREQNKKSEKAPDMTGHLTVGGVRYRLAGWTKEGRDGRKFLSIVAEPPKEQRAQPEPQNAYAAAKGRQAPAGGPTFGPDDQIPFLPCR